MKLFSKILNWANEDKVNAGTGTPFDWYGMIKKLLGLTDESTEAQVNEAFNSAMAAEPDGDLKAIQGKVTEAQKVNEALVTEKTGLAAQVTELTTKVTAAESLAANEKSANAKLTQEKADLEKALVEAKGQFANERQARIKLLSGAALKEGRITKAELEDTEKLLANAQDFEAEAQKLSEKQVKFATMQLSAGLTRQVNADEQARGKRLQEMVNERMKTAAEDYDKAWAWVTRVSEEGKTLIAGMHRTENK